MIKKILKEIGIGIITMALLLGSLTLFGFIIAYMIFIVKYMSNLIN